MRNLVLLTAAFALALAAIVNVSTAQDDKKPEYSIKDVMKKCMKGGLCKKVASGTASAEEKKQLLAMFKAMAAQKPPKGDAKSWKKRAGALVRGANLAVKGEQEKATKVLKRAANCKKCHTAHK